MSVKDTEEIIQAQRNTIMFFVFFLKDFRSLEGRKHHLEMFPLALITSGLDAYMRTASGLN